MGSRVKPGIIQKRILERGKYFQFRGLDDHDAVLIVNSGTYLLSMECMLSSARTGNAYYTQLFNKWQLPCTVWTWTLDNVHTYFCDILRATLKLKRTWNRIGNTKQPNSGCWQHGTFSTFMWAVLILGCADHFPTISFWTINWHTGYFNPGERSHQFRVFISLPFRDRSCTVVICTKNRVHEPGSKIH